MTASGIALLCLIILLSTAVGTGLVRREALKRGLLDIPGARSSHDVPTARGGGLAIVVTSLVGIAVLAITGGLPVHAASALFGAGMVLAAIGFVDDLGHVAVRWRLLVQALAAAWVLWLLGPLPAQPLVGMMLDASWLWLPVMGLALVWWTNLYNFMDGIDGLAASNAVALCAVWAGLLWLQGDTTLLAAAVVLASASLGFLYWNWPPARVFMGDVGSGFLGMMLGVLALLLLDGGALSLWAVLIPMGTFAVDATWTLLRRIFNGAIVYKAHRSHAYQRLALRFDAHAPVTLGYAATTLLWLGPWALAAALYPSAGPIVALLAWAPLLYVAYRIRAGDSSWQM